MGINGYHYSSLSREDLSKIQQLELKLNKDREDKEDEVILLAFEKQKK
ncbi:MAG: hypothetical protein ACOCQN_01140 [Halanaerobiaceae bacterium]